MSRPMQKWIDAAWDVQGITQADLAGPSRVLRLSYWRQLLAVLMLDDGHSREDVAAAFRRDRTTVYYMERRGRSLLHHSKIAQWCAMDLRQAAGLPARARRSA